MSSINLRTLADLRESGPPEFFERDQVKLKALFVAEYERLTKKTLFEGQTEMFIIETLAHAFSVDNVAKQNVAEQNTVVWGEGDRLEDVAANVSIFKLQAQPARTTLSFFFDQPQPVATNIAAGTVVAGGGIQFASNEDVVIPAGALEVTVPATALTVGAAGNDIQPFAINQPVTALTAGLNVHNTSLTSGGSNEEDQERFRERTANGNFRISQGGSRPGYRELIKGVHPDIVDVSPVKPEPGFIQLYVLMNTGVPSPEVKALISDFLDPEIHYPMGDYPSLPDPTARFFDWTLIVRVDVADETIEALAEAKAREVFKGWSQTMGVRIAPSSITAEVRQLSCNIVDVETDGLPFTDLADTEFPVLGDLTVSVEVRPNV